MSDRERRLRQQDAAEKWLYENDLQYASKKLDWQVTRSDALAREGGESFSDDWLPHQPDANTGNYRVTPKGVVLLPDEG
jgi:hypothetical protein